MRKKSVRVTLLTFLAGMAAAMSAFSMTQGSVARASEPGLVGKVIVVDAGHGGPDSGAVGVDGVPEKRVTLAIAKDVARLLQQNGAVVYMTRTTDTDLATADDRAQRRRHTRDLRGRLEVYQKHHADAFISIHCNASTSPAWSGAQTIYMLGNESGQELAETVQASFRAHLLPTSRGTDPMRSLYLLKRIDGPAVLAEVGFISNPTECYYLQTTNYQHLIAMCISTSCIQYFAPPENGVAEPGSDASGPRGNLAEPHPRTVEPHNGGFEPRDGILKPGDVASEPGGRVVGPPSRAAELRAGQVNG